MPRPPSEFVRELSNDVKLLHDRDRRRQQEFDRQESRIDRLEARIEQLTRDLAVARQENSALRQRSDDQTRQGEAWATRAWTLVTVLVGAALSLASGLIVTLARK